MSRNLEALLEELQVAIVGADKRRYSLANFDTGIHAIQSVRHTSIFKGYTWRGIRQIAAGWQSWEVNARSLSPFDGNGAGNESQLDRVLPCRGSPKRPREPTRSKFYGSEGREEAIPPAICFQVHLRAWIRR